MTSPKDREPTEAMLPCPLCGDKDDYNPSVSTSYKYAHPGTASTDLVESGHYIECDKCGCCGPMRPVEEEAIAAWNRRAMVTDSSSPPVDHGRVEKLEEALRELLEPLERASAELVAHGMVADENAEAAFDRARAALTNKDTA